jgi:phosphoglucosamine mutase
VEALNERLDGDGRVLVRPSGTEPVVRVLAEAKTAQTAEDLCATVAALVERELG